MIPPVADDTDTDVAIVGGGLAGLSLAIQLRRQVPGARITVLERNTHPVPEAAFKVGESTVEIGAHYFAEVLGLREHLDERQLRKFGFRFFFSDGRDDIDACTELGVSRILATPSWQLDRGRFENFLAALACELGVDVRTGVTVRRLDIGQDGLPHRIVCEQEGEHPRERPRERLRIQARWLIDASGRAGLMRRKLDLTTANGHDANAVWWRVDGCVDPNAWSDDRDWLARCSPPDRWRSTNHMCGPGYWVWLIPLASGAHSLGIVCDAKLHPLETMNTHAKAMAWLHAHQPRVARALEAPDHALRDFAFLRNYSYGCKQVFSADRWALTGEAGLFLDPFYSPGSDFIAMSNTYICDLVGKDLGGQPFAAHAGLYQQLYLSFYDNMLPLYEGQYPLFGDAQVMPVKVIWDYTCYWALLAPLLFSRRLTDIAMMARIRPALMHGGRLNVAMQALLRDWGRLNAPEATAYEPASGRFLDQYHIDWFNEMNRALGDRRDDDAFAAHIESNLARMAMLAREILSKARESHPDLHERPHNRLDDHGLDTLLDGVAMPPDQLVPAWYGAAETGYGVGGAGAGAGASGGGLGT